MAPILMGKKHFFFHVLAREFYIYMHFLLMVPVLMFKFVHITLEALGGFTSF